MSDDFDFDFEAKVDIPKKETPKKNVKKETPKKETIPSLDLSALIERINMLESKADVVDELKEEITNLKTSAKLAKTAWLGFRKSVRKVCDPAHKDRVTTLAVLDEYFEVNEE